MTVRSTTALVFAATFALSALPAHADPLSLRGGAYEITSRLELPHLERWGIDKTTRICLPDIALDGTIPIPVLSTNNPFAKCAAEHVSQENALLQYDITCPERGSARAHASYHLAPDTFTGHIAMVMGAKNMTMMEIQHARRLGDCDSTGREAAVR